jgi:ribosomal protein S9
MKPRLITPVILTVFLSMTFAGDMPKPQTGDITVEVEGMGRNASEAMLSAKRAAVEKGIGTVIQSETEIKNFMVNKDVILTRTVGAIKSVTTLAESTGPDGAISIKIKAVVSKQKINDDLMALHILLESMEKPRVMVLMKESNMSDSAASGALAETEIINYLTRKGFSLVDQAAVGQLKKQEQAQSALEGNAAAAAAIGVKAGAEMIITGNATSRVAEEISKNLGGMKSCQADVSLKVVLCANAAIIAAKTEHAAAVHVNPTSGGAKAIADATRKALDRHLLEKIVASWQDQINNGMLLRVTVSDVKSFKSSKAVIDGLPALSSSVVKVTKRDWNQSTGILELDVLYKGNCDGFCETVDGQKLSEGSTVSVTGSASGSARLKVAIKGAQ